MIAGISTIIADPDGCLLFDIHPARSNIGDYIRRVSRVATLDGGSAVVDSGFSHTDRTVTLVLLNPSKELADAVKGLCEKYKKVLLFLEDGAYAAVPETAMIRSGVVSIRLLISGDPTVKDD